MLQVITGGMFAGKTDELLRRLERYIIAKRKVALVRPDVDTRDSITHNGKEYKAVVRFRYGLLRGTVWNHAPAHGYSG